MLTRSSLSTLALAGTLALGCGSRSEITAEAGGQGGAPASSTSTTSTTSITSTTSSWGGSAPFACPALAVTPPADVDGGGGLSARPALVFGTNNGRVVSVFHAWSKAPDAASALHVTTLEPWESWPPSAGDSFAIDPHGGQTFAVGDLLHGNVALLLWHAESEPTGDDGLAFANAVSAASPQTLELLSLAPIIEDPGAVALVRGHDTPPVGPNIGYLAMLALWDTRDAKSGAYGLKLAIGTGDTVLFGLTWRPGDPDLACAAGRIAAAAVRAGSSWLVLTASGTDLMKCSDAASPGPPSSLAVDRIDWGPPDVIDWAIQRVDVAPGSKPIERIRMIPTLDGGLALVQRSGPGGAELVRVDAKGAMHAAGTLSPIDGGRILFSEIVALSTGTLLAHVDEGAPGRVHLDLRDHDSVVRATATIEASGPIESLSVLQAKAGDAALLGWGTSDGRVQLARVGCAEGT